MRYSYQNGRKEEGAGRRHRGAGLRKSSLYRSEENLDISFYFISMAVSKR